MENKDVNVRKRSAANQIFRHYSKVNKYRVTTYMMFKNI